MTPDGDGADDSRCPLCGGRKSPGKTTYTVDLGTGVIVVRDVPAMVCDQCGQDWIGAETVRRLQELVAEARRARRQVEILAYDETETAA